MASIWENKPNSKIIDGKYLCAMCDKIVIKKPSQIKNNKNKVFFCNRDCRRLFLKTCKTKELSINLTNCFICNKEFTRSTYDLSRSKVHCCSRKCSAIYSSNFYEKYLVKCYNCNKEMRIRKSSFIRNRKLGYFCSQNCLGQFRNKKVNFNCFQCGLPCIQHNVVYSRSANHFCSMKCSSRYYSGKCLVENVFEELIQSICDRDGNKIKYIRNDRTAIKPLELDFYFPLINYAIEINGPSHYIPIFGEKSLKKQQKRDRRKIDMCSKINIDLVTISVLDVKKDDYNEIFKKHIENIKIRLNNNEARNS